MLESIIDLLTGGMAGGIVGAFGGLATKYLEFKTLGVRLDHDYKLADLDARLEAMQHKHELALADKQVERAQAEGEIQRDIGELVAFTESLKEQATKYGSFVDQVRGLMRPVLTIGAVIWLAWVTAHIWDMVGGLKAVPPDELMQMFLSLINASIFLATTGFTWWFGSRPSQPRTEKP